VELENKLATLEERNRTLEGLTNEAKLGEWQHRKDAIDVQLSDLEYRRQVGCDATSRHSAHN
jgi:hypothetical protein